MENFTHIHFKTRGADRYRDYTYHVTKSQKLQFFSGSNLDGQKQSWELKEGFIAAYAVQGRRPRMEDRFVVNENIGGTGVSLFAVFDGHGGEFAANYVQDKLVHNLCNKIIDIKKISSGEEEGIADMQINNETKNLVKPSTPKPLDKKLSFRKTVSTTDDFSNKSSDITDPELIKKLDNLPRPITRTVHPLKSETIMVKVPARSYIEESGKINYGKLLTDEVLTIDRLLVAAAKKNFDVAGTTALIAILDGAQLTVANVGDSRGVMCDSKGNAIPLSFDHKPQQVREKKRIKEAGGFVTFNGVWRVAGILATSRALGDYPLKDKKLVIADPDILTFDLSDHKPSFLVLASDGLWDAFSNDEAVTFIKERLNEPHYGAKSVTLQSYYRGSLDNITVIVISFKNDAFNS